MSKGLEALERIECDMEYVTRLDFVEPIVRGEVQQELYKIYHREERDLDIIEKELKELEEHEEILNDYNLTLANFREACLLLAMLKGEGLNIHDIAKQLEVLEIIKKKGIVFDVPESDYSQAHFDIRVYTRHLTSDEKNKFKEFFL